MEKWLETQLKRQAEAIPVTIRKTILQEGFIDKAVNIQDFNTPMEYLFDVYQDFIDQTGQLDDYSCNSCREQILKDWKQLKPFLEELEHAHTK